MKEIVVPLAVLASIASIVVPLPPALLDVLVVANLMLALVLLMSALKLSDPTKFSALPTLLLLATLYRLALNISTTRLILSRGEAGSTIEAFGSVVIQGNLVVGVVVFSLITIVQFIVIAKGAERVAEVAARFTLDAMPGKQMSIDAELRAGMIDFRTAKQKRQDLQIESRFYGALDGAMKFVKGDAIAGIIIIVVNIIGGLAVGIIMQGLEPALAASKYCLLSVGDGLASQIPALLNALAAGIVVTRVNRGDQASASSELLQQLSQYRLVTGLVGTISLMLALAPGMPVFPLVGVGVFLLVLTALKGVPVPEKTAVAPIEEFRPQSPQVLSLKHNLEANTLKEMETGWEKLKERLYTQRGIVLPRGGFVREKGAAVTEVALFIRDHQVCSLSVGQGGIVPCLEQLEEIVSTVLVELVDDAHTRRLLTTLESDQSELAGTVVPQIISLTQLTELCRSLVSENVSLRNFDTILQTIAECWPRYQNERSVLEEVRVRLKRSISKLAAPRQPVIVLDPISDFYVVQRERAAKSLECKDILELGEQVQRQLSASVSDIPVVLVVTRGARRLVKESLEMQGLRFPVFASEELAGICELVEFGRISFSACQEPEGVMQRLEAA